MQPILARPLILAVVAATGLIRPAIGVQETQPSGAPKAAPAIWIERPHHNFGEVQAKQTFHHDYVIQNNGEAPLLIDRVKTSCSCFTAESFDREIAPGKTGKIKAKFATRTFRGKIRKYLTIYTNMPGKNKLFRVSMAANVFTPIVIHPAQATFGSSIKLKTLSQTREVTISNQVDKTLEIGEVKSDASWFRTRLEEIEPGRLFRLTVETVPPLSNGINKGFITIPTNYPELKSIRVFVSAYIPPEVVVSPSMVRFPKVNPKAATRNLFVRHTRERELKISDIEVVPGKPSDKKGPTASVVATDSKGSASEAPPPSDPTLLKVTLHDHRPKGRAYRIFVEIPAGFVLPDEGMIVRLKTDEAACPVVDIPIKPVRPRRVPTAKRNPEKKTQRPR